MPNSMDAQNIPRRAFLRVAAGTAAFAAISRISLAETYPSRPVHLVVGFSAGSASGINARIIAQWISERFGQPFVVDNRAGAGGNIATEAVVRAPSDGYTLLYGSTAIAINATPMKVSSIIMFCGILCRSRPWCVHPS
jgi:tripartite-type tricarboxylate transporter receptor subunit TctC